MRFLVFAIFLLVCLGLWGREFLRVGESIRGGEDSGRVYRRFRRRTKGIALLIFLYILSVFYDDFTEVFLYSPQQKFLYFGMTIIALFWLLILASRDLKEAAFEALHARRQITQETISSIEKEIEKKQQERKAERRKKK